MNRTIFSVDFRANSPPAFQISLTVCTVWQIKKKKVDQLLTEEYFNDKIFFSQAEDFTDLVKQRNTKQRCGETCTAKQHLF